MSEHIKNQIQYHELRSDSTLHVVGVIINPIRYHSRYRIFREWEKEMLATPNVKLYVVEAAFGDRKFEVTTDDNPNHLQIRTNQEIWIKENMINLGVRHLLPKDWRYMAWVDCDVFFRSRDWATETLHQLQHYAVIQPWQDCMDLGFHGNVYQHFKSFGFQHQLRVPKQMYPEQKEYRYAHSGFAWACTRAFYENIQGLLDVGILGSSDHHMAFAMIGQARYTVHAKMSAAFLRRVLEWQHRAVMVTHNEVGFANGRIEHQFHGPKARRLYRDRWQIMIQNGFNPDTDLMHDPQGVLRVVGKPALLHAIHQYNVGRLEDSTEENV